MLLPRQFEEMKRYVRFGPRDEEVLRELSGHVRPHFDAIAREFYERSREHEDAHAVFKDEAQIARLHASLVAWFERILTGPYDAAYCERSLAIGRAHVRVGLPQRFMFTGMALIRARMQDIAAQTMGPRSDDARAALNRILDIELGLMNESYLDAVLERSRRIEAERRADAVERMAQSERQHVHAVELAGAMIVGLDGQGRIRLFNRQAAAITGFEPSEIFGQPFSDLLSDPQAFSTAMERIASGGREAQVAIELAVKTRAGRLRTIEAQLARGDGNGHALHILAGKDVTSDRALAARLRQSERLAAVGMLASGLAHEIRNPLNGALLHLTYLRRAAQKSPDGGDCMDAIEVVTAEIKRLGALVSDFLSFARPGKLSRKPTNIQQLCRRALSLVEARGVAIACELPDAEIIAELDAAKIEQALINLLDNAIEAAAGGAGSQAAVRAYRQPLSAVIEVQDDGPGVPSKDAPIFDAFYSTKPGGTGLGLSIVHRIVTDHDGTIDVDSEPGRTVFRVVLPLHAPAPAPSRPTL